MTLITRMEEPIAYTVADNTGIEKGALLKLTNSGTAIISSAQTDPCAGIVASEKIADSGRTQRAVFKRGRFRGTASGAVNTGEALISYAGANSNANKIGVGTGAVSQSGAAIIGYAEGDAVDGGRFPFMLNL